MFIFLLFIVAVIVYARYVLFASPSTPKSDERSLFREEMSHQNKPSPPQEQRAASIIGELTPQKIPPLPFQSNNQPLFMAEMIFPNNQPITTAEAKQNYRSYMSSIYFDQNELPSSCSVFWKNLQCATSETKENVRYRQQDLREAQKELKNGIKEYLSCQTKSELSAILGGVKGLALAVAECEYDLQQAIDDRDEFSNDKRQFLIDYINSEIHGYNWSLPAGDTLHFIYKSLAGDVTARTVKEVSKEVSHFTGFCMLRNSERTFYKRSVLEYVASEKNLPARLEYHSSIQKEKLKEKLKKQKNRAREILKEALPSLRLSDDAPKP